MNVPRQRVGSTAVQLSALGFGAAPIGNLYSAVDEGDALADYSKAATGTDLIGRTLLTFDKATSGRYVLLWLTKLPAVNGGFRGQLAEVTVRGS